MIYFVLGGKYVAIAHKRALRDSALVQELLVYLRPCLHGVGDPGLVW